LEIKLIGDKAGKAGRQARRAGKAGKADREVAARKGGMQITFCIIWKK